MNRTWPRLPAVAAFGLVVAIAPRPGQAFLKTCHQGLTTDALEAAPWPSGAVPPPLTREQKLLRNELTIDLSPRVTDFWSMSLLIGNQFNDSGSYDETDFVALAEVTARPELQRMHCLRAPDDDGPAGDTRALAACKAFILEQVAAALGDGENPDVSATETVPLHLVFRGAVDLPLARYAFHMGQATHALQDSFTHAFRTSDFRGVRTVLNWVDWVNDDGYQPARDGFQHMFALDTCGASDVGGLERRAVARQTTSQLLAAVADDEGGRAGRLARASAVVDEWFAVTGGCTAENHWCDAPEQKLVTTSGCASAPPARRSGGGEAAVTLLGMAILASSRPREPDGGDQKGGAIAKADPAQQRRLEEHPFGVIASGGFSIDDGGYHVGVGTRYDLGRRFTIGATAEYSPWISLAQARQVPGTTNVFGVGIFRLDVRDYLEVRLTASLGASVLMYDTFAAKRGSVGPYFALSPVGIGIRMNERLRLLIDPGEIAISVPKVTGIPLAYREHRFTVAVQANF